MSIKFDINLTGQGYTQAQANTMQTEILTYAQANNLKGSVNIIQIL